MVGLGSRNATRPWPASQWNVQRAAKQTSARRSCSGLPLVQSFLWTEHSPIGSKSNCCGFFEDSAFRARGFLLLSFVVFVFIGTLCRQRQKFCNAKLQKFCNAKPSSLSASFQLGREKSRSTPSSTLDFASRSFITVSRRPSSPPPASQPRTARTAPTLAASQTVWRRTLHATRTDHPPSPLRQNTFSRGSLTPYYSAA